MKKGPLYYAKILLFGEYGIIQDSQGLAIPYESYRGGLKKSGLKDEKQKRSNENLRKFFAFLKRRAAENPELIDLDFDTFEKDLNEGLYFDSNIPEGYGVGSSGAIVAAIYERYANNKISVLENLTSKKLLKLKSIFAAMEDFFHGKSSGLDPLNSYLSVPILIHSKEELEATGIPEKNPEGKGAIFLIDSGQIGETGPMVQIFMEKLKNEGFRKVMKDEFIKYTNQSVQDFIKGDFQQMLKNVRRLSRTVYHHFQPMIPVKMLDVWKKGMETGDYYLKLCGSGGGGFILGFTDDFEKTKEQLKDYKLEVIYRF
jgi:mevalonate kinase